MVSLKSLLACVVLSGVLVVGAVAQDRDDARKVAEQAAQEVTGRQATELGENHMRFIEEAARKGQAAQQNPGTEEDRAFYMQQETVDRYTEQHRQWFQEQVSRSADIARDSIVEHGQEHGIEPEQATAQGPYFLVFVSQSMGKEGLRRAFAYGQGREDVAFAFIGYRPDQSHMSFMTAMQQIIGPPEDGTFIPSVMLNPPAFVENDIGRVPAVVKFDALGNPIAKVEGVANPQWLEDRIDRGLKPSYGAVGETYAIAERNLIDSMKEKAAAFDYEEESKKAAVNYFENMATLELPYASEQRRREMLAKMVVQEDVVDHEGVVRHRRGEEISMVDEMPHAPVLVIFNSLDPYHVEFARSVVSRYPDRNVILMTTQVDREGGFAGYIKREVEIGRPVYLLTQDVMSTFRIEMIPTLVTPMEDRFAIVEVPLQQGEKDHGPRHLP